tara:strand:+ start:122 stop:355 length:234 start_codon:yes stop_codon:yes gene_type:complete
MAKDINYILKKILLKKTKKKIKDNFIFVRSGLFDSIDILNTISEIESKFKIKFSEKDLSNIKNFDIKKITQLIKKKL